MPYRELFESGYLTPAIEWIGEQIPGGFFIYRADEKMELLYVNNAVLRIFGCETRAEFNELTGNSFAGLVHPEDYETIRSSIERQIAETGNEKRDFVEYRVIRKDGTVRWVDDYGHFAQMPGYGDVYYVFISDITEKHRVREEKDRNALIYAGRIDQFNAMAEESLSVSRSNLTTGVILQARGRDLFDTDVAGGREEDSFNARLDSFILEADRKRYEDIFSAKKLIERFNQGESAIVFTGFCRRQSGKQCFVKFSRSLVPDPVSGDLIAFSVETESNTEKVEEVLNQKILAQQYDMVTYIVNGMYSVVIGDAARIGKGSIFPRERNGNYAAYLEEQVLPAASEEIHDRAELARALAFETVVEKLSREESYTVDMTCLIEGEIFNKRISFYAVDRDANFYLLLKSDVTDVLRQEQTRHRILTEALKEAEQANAAKTSFLSNMSHEIRTPMNAIIGLNSLALADPDLPEKTRSYLERIGKGARHLLDLINGILDMSRIESGRMVLRKSDFSLRLLLEQITTMVQSQCREKGIHFSCKIPEDDTWYFGDHMKLKQILINLLSNAVKFTEEGGSVTLSVKKGPAFERQTTLLFTVKDTGLGMDKDFLPRIFEPFSQEDGSRRNRFGSTGLGMAITKNLVDMMGGTIAVSSEKGVGTEFTVTVTLRQCDPVDNSEAIHAQHKVLAVAANSDDLAGIAIVLEEAGVTAETCVDASDALRAVELSFAKSEPFDLILVDEDIQELAPEALARAVRERAIGETVTAYLTNVKGSTLKEDPEIGVIGVIPKPLSVKAIRRLLKSRNKRENEQKKPAALEGKHILLAEDMPVNAEIMKELLAMRRMVVSHAENGRKALELFQNSEEGFFDAILMDVRMPVMDGLEATAAIRALPRPDAGTVPIIAVTANAFDEDVKQSLQAGMNAHLSKPVEPDRLYEILSELIPE